ncbi:MAG: hypothetical protein HOF44_05365 [Pelagibacterales bacterium]|nr:hypothetical protein [Pelagibacterales bacterium]MBT4109271.1 hypothetical protein [Pelagibacterales bacterium]
MVNKNIVTKKKITSAMKDLEEAILIKNKKSSVKRTKVNIIKKKSSISEDNTEVLLLTDIIEESPFLNRDSSSVILKKNIQLIIEADIKSWIKNNMHVFTDQYIKQVLKTLN